MKIAISADGSNLDANVGYKLGISPYLIILDTETMDYEAVRNPSAEGHRGGGIQALVVILSKGVKQVLTGHCSPAIVKQLKDNGVDIFTGIDGTVREVVEDYKQGTLRKRQMIGTERKEQMRSEGALTDAVVKAGRQFATLLPALLGVVLLLGLVQAFVSQEVFKSLFSGEVLLDTLWGACFGSILAGNPINSYVIGGELLKYGVSLFAITALIIAWVTVGIVQLPAEIIALGKRFALLRNGLAFALSILTALVTVTILGLITG
jgi:predicted Fe-Mo cluster-binding NifX family protein